MLNIITEKMPYQKHVRHSDKPTSYTTYDSRRSSLQ